MLSWLPERSVDAVREALSAARPDLCALPIVLHEAWVDTGNPLWARSSAFVDRAWVVKFAWSEVAAARLEREIAILRALADGDHLPPTPRVESLSSDPVLLVSPFVPGTPVTGEAIAAYSPIETDQLAHNLASVLTAFHRPATRDAIERSDLLLPSPTPQATTEELLERLCPMLDPIRR